MNDQELAEKIKKVIKKSRGTDPNKPRKLISLLFDIKKEAEGISYKKAIIKLWSKEWEKTKDKIKFEKNKRNQLNKMVNDINPRVFESELCFYFFIKMEKNLIRIINDAEIIKEIHIGRIQKISESDEGKKDKKQIAELKNKLLKKLEEKYLDFKSKSIKQEILERIEKKHRYLDLKYLGGITPFRENAIPLDKIYIQLKATEDYSLSEASTLTEEKIQLSGITENNIREKEIVEEKSSSHPLPVEKVLQNVLIGKGTSKRQMVFLGPSGSGKTTILKYLAHSIASGKAEKWDIEGFIPLYINLPVYTRKSNEDLVQYTLEKIVENIADTKKKNDIKRALRHAIDGCKENSQADGRVIFLLDALDETGDEKSEVVEQIEELHNTYQKALIIVTSRTIDYYEAPLNAFSRYLLEDLRIEDINGFITAWFEEFAKIKTEEEPEENWNDWSSERTSFLINKIEKNQSIRRIASNPLYLTFMVLLASDPDTKILPETRSGLYKTYFDKLLLKWEDNKKHELPFETKKLKQGFREICWILHRALYGNIKDDYTKEFIEKSIEDSFDEDPEKLLDFWIKAGIFFMVKTRNQEKLILHRHLSFLEYGFACKLTHLWKDEGEKEDIWNKLKTNLHNIHLQEPLMLFIGQLKEPDYFIKRVWNLEDDDFHRNLIFSGKGINEAKNKLKDRKIIKDVLDRLIGIYNSDDDFVFQVEEKILEGIGLLGGIEGLLKLLKVKTDPHSQSEIMRAIGSLENKPAIPVLKQLFNKTNNSSVCRLIAESIGRFGDKESAISLLEQLFHKEKDVLVCCLIAKSISRLGNLKTAISLLKQLCDKEEDPYLRCCFAMFMGRFGDIKSAISLLEQLFKKEEVSNVRRLIAICMGMVGDESTIPLIVELHSKEKDLIVNYSLAKAIKRIRKSATPSQEKTIFDENKNLDISHLIQEATSEMEKDSTIPFLTKIINKKRKCDEDSSINGFKDELEDESTTKMLEELYYDEERHPHPDMSIATAKLLGILLNKPAAQVFPDLYDSEKDPAMRKSIAGWIYDTKIDKGRYNF